MTKTEAATLEAIRTAGHASNVWISRAAGRVYFAGEFKCNDKVLAKLAAKGAIKAVRVEGQMHQIIQAV